MFAEGHGSIYFDQMDLSSYKSDELSMLEKLLDDAMFKIDEEMDSRNKTGLFSARDIKGFIELILNFELPRELEIPKEERDFLKATHDSICKNNSITKEERLRLETSILPRFFDNPEGD